MALMVNELLQRLSYVEPLDFHINNSPVKVRYFFGENETDEQYQYKMEYFLNKRRRIYVGQGANVVIKLNEKWFDKIHNRLANDDDNNNEVLDPNEATHFL